MLKNIHCLCLMVLFVLCFFCSGETAHSRESLDSMLSPHLTRYNLPSLAAAVVREGRIIAAGAVGTRRAGYDLPVTLNDSYHLGSDTKAMTALLTESGRVRYRFSLACG